MDINNLIIEHQKTIRQALELIDVNALGTLFVVDSDQKLIGIVTDGDIRRGLLRGELLNSNIDKVMNKNYLSLPVETDNDVILDYISTRIKIIPLIDKANRVVDYASITKIRKIPVASPLLTGNELAYVTDCIKTGWISSQGKYVRRFEEQFRTYINKPHVLAVSNGTVALHLALVALGIGAGHEVILPDFTFAASINAVIYTGATPVLADIDMDTWTISIESLESLISPRTKAIMPVHIYGHPCRMDEIMEIAKKHNLLVIEDCAEALGSEYKGKPIGTFGDAATFSFFGNKTLTTGEGGMIAFKDKEVFQRAEILRDHGMSKDRRYWHVDVGFNYRMTNMQAAVGVAQMERLEEFVNLKREIAAAYHDGLQHIQYIKRHPEATWAKSSYWLYTILVSNDSPVSRDELIDRLLKNGIETRPVFFPIHLMPPYQKYAGHTELPNTIKMSEQGMSLPSSVSLSKQDLQMIVRAIVMIFENKEMTKNSNSLEDQGEIKNRSLSPHGGK